VICLSIKNVTTGSKGVLKLGPGAHVGLIYYVSFYVPRLGGKGKRLSRRVGYSLLEVGGE